MSTDDEPENLKPVLRCEQATRSFDFISFPEQKSKSVKLRAGKKYYYQLIHFARTNKQAHLFLHWSLKDDEPEAIPAACLRPLPASKKTPAMPIG